MEVLVRMIFLGLRMIMEGYRKNPNKWAPNQLFTCKRADIKRAFPDKELVFMPEDWDDCIFGINQQSDGTLRVMYSQYEVYKKLCEDDTGASEDGLEQFCNHLDTLAGTSEERPFFVSDMYLKNIHQRN
jgi:hypothetical protein